MQGPRWRIEAVVAALLMAVVLGIGARALWRATRPPIHEDAAGIGSTTATYVDRYASPVDASRRLARTLTAGGNLPGLSVAVAVDGQIVWAEAFGWADVESRTALTPLTHFRLGAASKPLTS